MAGSYESHVPAHRSLGRIARIGLACVFSARSVFCDQRLYGFIKHKVPKYDSGSLYVSRRQIKYSKYRASRALSQGTISLSLSASPSGSRGAEKVARGLRVLRPRPAAGPTVVGGPRRTTLDGLSSI